MAKTYPKRELTAVTLSTVVPCAGCGQPTGVHERLLTDGDGFYHRGCAPTETPVVHTLEIGDDLKIKSQ